ncbi:MAG: hypothetical protein ACOX63_02340 [Christensenellales bacterium]
MAGGRNATAARCGQRRAPAARDEANRQPNEQRRMTSAAPSAQAADYCELWGMEVA